MTAGLQMLQCFFFPAPFLCIVVCRCGQICKCVCVCLLCVGPRSRQESGSSADVSYVCGVLNSSLFSSVATGNVLEVRYPTKMNQGDKLSSLSSAFHQS